MKEALDRLEQFKRSELVDSRGRSFNELQKRLTPRYLVVWRDILAGWAGIFAIATCVCLYPSVWVALAGGCAMGFLLLYLHNFFHEAAHYNLAPRRDLNDVLANIFLGCIMGQEIKIYRVVHFDHHRHLGTPEDTEHTYFFPLNWRFVLGALSGATVLRILLSRDKHLSDRPTRNRSWLLMGMTLNALIVASSFLAGYWSLSLAWVLAMLSFFPLFNSLRNLLEHRSEDADPAADYFRVFHGAVNRLFGDGPLASTLGSAGFNRHLLHHWAPQISYTRLRELETYLMDTEMGPYLASRQTTYLATLQKLWSA